MYMIDVDHINNVILSKCSSVVIKNPSPKLLSRYLNFFLACYFGAISIKVKDILHHQYLTNISLADLLVQALKSMSWFTLE